MERPVTEVVPGGGQPRRASARVPHGAGGRRRRTSFSMRSHHLVGVQPRAVHQHGVGGRPHRGQVAGGVAAVALLLGRAARRPIPPPRRGPPSRAAGGARSTGSATRKNLQAASGKTTVPWSRPSQTMSRPRGDRTLQVGQPPAHHRAVGDRPRRAVTSAVRIGRVTSSPLSSTWPGGISRRSRASRRPSAA